MPLENMILINYVNASCDESYNETTEETQVAVPVLEITKESIPVYTEPGAEILYKIRVNNVGLAEATNVVVKEKYDENIIFLYSSPPSAGDMWLIPELDAGNFFEIEIYAKVSEDTEEGSVLINYVNVTCDEDSYDEAEAYTVIHAYPPETYKQFHGKVVNITFLGGTYLLHYILENTTISLVATDNGSGVNVTYYRIFKWLDGGWRMLFDWQEYGVWNAYPPYCPINLAELGELYGFSRCGKYEIEFYSIDNAGNEEDIKWNDVYVDCFTPFSLIEQITPYEIHGRSVDIIAYAGDIGVGVDKVKLYYRYSEDNVSWGSWIYYGERSIDYTWHFEMMEDGYYQFYTVAYDKLGKHEPLPNGSTVPKAICKIYYPWDANGDGKVGIEDILFVMMHWMQTPGDESWDPRADVNDDGIVDVDDVIEIIKNWTG